MRRKATINGSKDDVKSLIGTRGFEGDEEAYLIGWVQALEWVLGRDFGKDELYFTVEFETDT